ncbi:type II toxin-antitoxin system PemK/MazF family toxin [Sporofaciens musculi]|jgi:mRNA interferase MazF|uniref:type II toxin-antitoxin system PemK/MazF family toxin n=1 Tax=Sporofaciens musculi TaxID=2681861 RepID=UPI00216F5E96|nr:type II toxin-antitoxin system PemK/MazF family toxin [Sporofaciens musculi]MCI9229450.1 type II toxin-antitoxin system PemK/MazF family toxin [Dorea sp.]
MKIFNDVPVTEFKRGDVVFIENPLQGTDAGNHVVCGNHPAVVIQNQKGNDCSPNLIVAYLTSQIKRVEMKTHVLLTWYDELKTSMIQAEQLATVDKSAVLGYITHLRDEDIVRLDRALLASLGMD